MVILMAWCKTEVSKHWRRCSLALSHRYNVGSWDVIKWKHLPRDWLFVRGIHRSPVVYPHKGQWRGALMFSLICTRTNKRLSKQSRRWWFETPLRPLWHNCNAFCLSVLRTLWHLVAELRFRWQPGVLKVSFLTHWGRDKMDAISQTTFSSAFSWMKMFEFRLKFHWSLFLMVQLTIFHHWFRWWFGAVQAPSHYLNQRW